MKIDHNWFYANNLDIYREDNPFGPLVGRSPSGPASSSGGQQRRQLHDNWVFDNWRQGTMLVAVPTRSPTAAAPRATLSRRLVSGRANQRNSTSCGNRFCATASAGRRAASASRVRSTRSATCTLRTTRSRRSRAATTFGGASSSAPTRGIAGSTTLATTDPRPPSPVLRAGALPGDPPRCRRPTIRLREASSTWSTAGTVPTRTRGPRADRRAAAQLGTQGARV